MPQTRSLRSRLQKCRHLVLIMGGFGGLCAMATGCQDGPLYALKAANPYFAMKEWKADEDIGVTDHVRRGQMMDLAESIGGMPVDRQAFWAQQLDNILENDSSSEMRRLAIAAAGSLADPTTSMTLIQKGIDDSVTKVRMEACRALGKQSGDEAARMLAAMVGTDTDLDVRQSAISALANHRNSISQELLRRTLEDRDPATRALAVTSLRKVTGQDFGDDPASWIAALDASGTAPGLNPTAGESRPSIASLPEFFGR